MTKMITHSVSVEIKGGPDEFDLRLASGRMTRFKRGISDAEAHDLEMTEEECRQLESEGYKVKPGLSAYRPKAKKPKKFGGVKDIAAPNKEEE